MSSPPDPDFVGLVADLGGIILCSAASLSPSPTWLRAHLGRVLGAAGLGLEAPALDAYISAGVALSSSPDPCVRAADAANAHAATLFGVGAGTKLMRCVLGADITAAGYDARTRESCLRMLACMRLQPRVLYEVEGELGARLAGALVRDDGGVGGGAGESEIAEDVRVDESMQRHARGRWLKIGGATAISGVLLGMSGGMLAPAILPALSAAGLGVAGSAGASTAVAAAFGVGGAGIGASAMRNRVGAVQEFRFERCVVVDGAGVAARGEGDVTVEVPRLEIDIDAEGLVEGSGLLVYAFELSQSFASSVCGGVRFGVGLGRDDGVEKKKDDEAVDWVIDEETFDAGGRSSVGGSKRQRYTGAVAIPEKPQCDKPYFMRWTLRPGSRPVHVSFRAAWVLPGTEMPPWIAKGKEEGENGGGDGQLSAHRAPSLNRISALTVSLFVPGLLNAKYGTDPGSMSDQFCAPGGVVDTLRKTETESFALVWETEILSELSRALYTLGRNAAVSYAVRESALALSPALMGAVALPISIVSAVTGVIDNIWSRAMSRAVSAGIMLAAEIAARGFGKRPISLSGYSLGALMVFTACEELARRDLDGLIHDIHLIGAPLSSSSIQRWDAVRKIVSGRLVNVYNRADWYLELLSKGTGNYSSRLAGRAPVLHAGVQNVSLADIDVTVVSHGEYASRASEILVKIGVGKGEQTRDWPWAWTPRDGDPSSDLMRLNLDEIDDGANSPGLTSSASFEIPTSPPVEVFKNSRLKHRNRRGSQSQPPRRSPKEATSLSQFADTRPAD